MSAFQMWSRPAQTRGTYQYQGPNMRPEGRMKFGTERVMVLPEKREVRIEGTFLYISLYPIRLHGMLHASLSLHLAMDFLLIIYTLGSVLHSSTKSSLNKRYILFLHCHTLLSASHARPSNSHHPRHPSLTFTLPLTLLRSPTYTPQHKSHHTN